MFEEVIGVSLLCCVAWLVCRSFRPPPPKICGEPGGPPITGPRIKLRDGRYLSYQEQGVAKETAKYKMVFVHGTSTNKHDAWIATSGLAQELGAYIVSFDRPGYGESTPNPNRTIKSTALDIEDLADQLGLGPKFYVVGYSMGGQSVWGCLKYIPHRLAGATLVAPVINYWWPGFPKKLKAKELSEQLRQDQFALRVAHYAPWLLYWWNTQNWFSGSSVIRGKARMTPQDIEFIIKSHANGNPKEYSTKQGMYESYMRDMMIGFGKWEFDPMDLKDPFAGQEGAVHLWHGSSDGLVPVALQRYIAERLPWIHYHEIPKGGHLFCYADDVKDDILRTLLA
ncbi:hypothetical protein Leryth_008679 [Lithospermum erythrorhizon]|nr:hypothetical protein Leryth_008679 [Lithospermum erythrorhizon]